MPPTRPTPPPMRPPLRVALGEEGVLVLCRISGKETGGVGASPRFGGGQLVSSEKECVY